MLEEVGFSREEAETTIRILDEVMEDKLATKHDLKELESRLTLKLGAMISAAIAVLTAIQKLIH